jgi:hypothetical protein
MTSRPYQLPKMRRDPRRRAKHDAKPPVRVTEQQPRLPRAELDDIFGRVLTLAGDRPTRTENRPWWDRLLPGRFEERRNLRQARRQQRGQQR